MAEFYEKLTEELKNFITEQKIFFTATAPHEGRINLSPKGIDTFRVIDRQTVAYLDLTGSGNETAAHLNENERMTIMFCSFSNIPLILRLYGKGRVIKQTGDCATASQTKRDKKPSDRWQELSSLFPTIAGTRQIILLNIESVQTSCGFGVPMYEFQSQRSTLIDWAVKKGNEGLKKYWQKKNQVSIDGLPTKLLE
jgi:hypothetical protein